MMEDRSREMSLRRIVQRAFFCETVSSLIEVCDSQISPWLEGHDRVVSDGTLDIQLSVS